MCIALGPEFAFANTGSFRAFTSVLAWWVKRVLCLETVGSPIPALCCAVLTFPSVRPVRWWDNVSCSQARLVECPVGRRSMEQRRQSEMGRSSHRRSVLCSTCLRVVAQICWKREAASLLCPPFAVYWLAHLPAKPCHTRDWHPIQSAFSPMSWGAPEASETKSVMVTWFCFKDWGSWLTYLFIYLLTYLYLFKFKFKILNTSF